jgi:acyl dehydratase
MTDPEWYFAEFAVGQEFTTMARTFAESDMLRFIELAGLYEEIWINANRLEATGMYHGRLVPGYMTLTFLEGLFVLTGRMRHAVGLLGLTDLVFPNPVYCGDTVHGIIKVVDTRHTKRADRGVIRTRHFGLNQDGTEVVRYSSARVIQVAPAQD